MRTIAPKTTCAKPITSARYPSRLTVCISVRNGACRRGGHLMRAVIHLHVIVPCFNSLPGRDKEHGEDNRGNDRPNQLRQW